jgi:hypothetical protein
MKAFASRTGTRRNLAALREAGWGLLVSASGVWRTEGFAEWAAENGQWTERDTPGPFNSERYERFLSWAAAQPIRPQWLAIPDIVYGGLASLDLSRAWLRKLRRRKAWREQRFLIVVQDGMEPRHVRRLLNAKVGIFVGGSTEWKLATMRQWAALARSRAAICHVGRVNTAKRIRLCEAAGVDSFDGTSATRFAVTLGPLELARQQTDLEGYIARKAA